MQEHLILLPLLFYSTSTLLFLAYLFNFKERILLWSKWILFAAFLVHLSTTGYTHIVGGATPILHPYSLLSLAVLSAAGLFLLIDLYVKITIFGSFLIPMITLLLLVIYINLTGTTGTREESQFVKFITPVHITASYVGFLLFFIAFLSSVLYILQDYRLRLKKEGGFKIPSLAKLERIAFRSVTIGFPIYSFGIILGTVWSFICNSHFFSHQYVLALASWVIYGLLLFFYITSGWHGRKASIMMMAGFLCTLGVVLIYLLRMVK